eukprot:scaffold239693_cov28-Tisochrysis_lutea.AAC.2
MAAAQKPAASVQAVEADKPPQYDPAYEAAVAAALAEAACTSLTLELSERSSSANLRPTDDVPARRAAVRRGVVRFDFVSPRVDAPQVKPSRARLCRHSPSRRATPLTASATACASSSS